VQLELSNNSSPAAAKVKEFLGVEREFYMGIIYLVIIIIATQILSYVFLRILV